MKKFTDSLKKNLTDPGFLVSVALLVLLFIPLIIKMARKIPGADKVIDKLPTSAALILGLLMLGSNANASGFDSVATAPIVSVWQLVALCVCLLLPLTSSFMRRKSFRQSSLSSIGCAALAIVVMVGMTSRMYAADQLIHKGAFANSLVLRPGSSSYAGTNYFRVYSANRSNYFDIGTNAAITQQIGLTNYTGYTGTIPTNPGINVLLFKNGLLVSTNGF